MKLWRKRGKRDRLQLDGEKRCRRRSAGLIRSVVGHSRNRLRSLPGRGRALTVCYPAPQRQQCESEKKTNQEGDTIADDWCEKLRGAPDYQRRMTFLVQAPASFSPRFAYRTTHAIRITQRKRKVVLVTVAPILWIRPDNITGAQTGCPVTEQPVHYRGVFNSSITRRARLRRGAGSCIVDTPLAERPNGRRPGRHLIREVRIYSEEAKPRERIPNLSPERRLELERGRVNVRACPATLIVLLRRVLGSLSEPGLRVGLEQRGLRRGRSGRPHQQPIVVHHLFH